MANQPRKRKAEQTKAPAQGDEEGSRPKHAYHAPSLKHFGSIRQITRGSGGSAPDDCSSNVECGCI